MKCKSKFNIYVLFVSIFIGSAPAAQHRPNTPRMFEPGGGSINERTPDCAPTGKDIVVLIDLAVWGSGGDIADRFFLRSFEYRLAGEAQYYRSTASVYRQDAQHKVMILRIPPYPKGTVGTLEYRFTVELDNNSRTINGKRKVRIGPFLDGACAPVA